MLYVAGLQINPSRTPQKFWNDELASRSDDPFVQILLKLPDNSKQYFSSKLQSVVEMAILFVTNDFKKGQALLHLSFRFLMFPSLHVMMPFSMEQVDSEQQ